MTKEEEREVDAWSRYQHLEFKDLCTSIKKEINKALKRIQIGKNYTMSPYCEKLIWKKIRRDYQW
jgi:hypothetical protein